MYIMYELMVGQYMTMTSEMGMCMVPFTLSFLDCTTKLSSFLCCVETH